MAARVQCSPSFSRTLIAKPVLQRGVCAKATKLATTYAKALVGLAEEQDALEAVHTDVAGLDAMLKADDTMRSFLFNPIISAEKKGEVIDSIAKESGFQQMTGNFLKLLVDRQRIDNLEGIVEEFETMYCELTDTQVATLRSAVKLEQEQQFLVAKKLQEITGSKNIKVKPVIDEELIAGFIVEYGSNQIDLSINGALNRISTELQGAVESA